jgi:hypothetical protein
VLGWDEIRGERSQLLEELEDELEREAYKDDGGDGGGGSLAADKRRVRFSAAHHKNDRCGPLRTAGCAD